MDYFGFVYADRHTRTWETGFVWVWADVLIWHFRLPDKFSVVLGNFLFIVGKFIYENVAGKWIIFINTTKKSLACFAKHYLKNEREWDKNTILFDIYIAYIT